MNEFEHTSYQAVLRDKLLNDFSRLVYDGATNFDYLVKKLNQKPDAYILITDGISSIGSSAPFHLSAITYVIGPVNTDSIAYAGGYFFVSSCRGSVMWLFHMSDR